MFKPADLFDLTQTEHAALFDGCEFAWDVLKKLKDYVEAHAQPLLKNTCDGVAYIGEKVSIGEGTVIEDGAMIKGPAIIGRNCQIRHNAYIREHVVVGDGCVVGNSCELKHAILFNNCQIPHFNYVGDSILGYKAHIGAGVILSNLKSVPGFPENQATLATGGNVGGTIDLPKAGAKVTITTAVHGSELVPPMYKPAPGQASALTKALLATGMPLKRALCRAMNCQPKTDKSESCEFTS